MATAEQINDPRVLQNIVAQLELEVRTAHAFMAMMLLASGGTIDVPVEVAESIPEDFEVAVTRDEKVATFRVVSGEEAEALRKGRDTIQVNA